MSLDCTTRFYNRCTFGRSVCSAKKMACYVRGSVPLQANNGAKYFFAVLLMLFPYGCPKTDVCQTTPAKSGTIFPANPRASLAPMLTAILSTSDVTPCLAECSRSRIDCHLAPTTHTRKIVGWPRQYSSRELVAQVRKNCHFRPSFRQ